MRVCSTSGGRPREEGGRGSPPPLYVRLANKKEPMVFLQALNAINAHDVTRSQTYLFCGWREIGGRLLKLSNYETCELFWMRFVAEDERARHHFSSK